MLRKLLCLALWAVASFFRLSYRFRYFGVENLEQARLSHPAGAYCLGSWHEHAAAGVLGQAGLPYCTLISKSSDGELVDFICRKMGYRTVRGSSSRGGKEARSQLEALMGEGIPTAFMVDGPRGPRHQSKPGILKTAMSTGAAILPVAAISAEPWVLAKAWDQTKIPRPFSKIAYQFGPIMILPPDLEGEEFDAALAELNRRLKETEALACGNLARLKEGRKLLPAPPGVLGVSK